MYTALFIFIIVFCAAVLWMHKRLARQLAHVEANQSTLEELVRLRMDLMADHNRPPAGTPPETMQAWEKLITRCENFRDAETDELLAGHIKVENALQEFISLTAGYETFLPGRLAAVTEQIRAAGRQYNEILTEYNKAVSRPPGRWIAAVFLLGRAEVFPIDY